MESGVRYVVRNVDGVYVVSRLEGHIDATGQSTGSVRTIEFHNNVESAERRAKELQERDAQRSWTRLFARLKTHGSELMRRLRP
jgi:hypothetical protein